MPSMLPFIFSECNFDFQNTVCLLLGYHARLLLLLDFSEQQQKKSLCRASDPSLLPCTFSGLIFPSNRFSLIGYPVLPGVPWKHENVTICLSCALGREPPTPSLSSLQDSLGHFLSYRQKLFSSVWLKHSFWRVSRCDLHTHLFGHKILAAKVGYEGLQLLPQSSTLYLVLF